MMMRSVWFYFSNPSAMRVHPGSSSPNGVGVAINGSDVANVAATTTNGTNGGDCNGSATRAAMVAVPAAVEVTAEAELYRKKVRIGPPFKVIQLERLKSIRARK